MEILAPCPTGHGKKNKIDAGKKSWEWLKEITILKGVYDKLSENGKKQNQKIILGELHNIEKQEFTKSVYNI